MSDTEYDLIMKAKLLDADERRRTGLWVWSALALVGALVLVTAVLV